MELDAEGRYSLAALFTLALHESARSANPQLPEAATAWGEPAWLEDSAAAAPPLTRAEWDAYWGWDFVAPGGLLDQVYAQLGVPRSKWPGLKVLPLVDHSDRVPLEVVRSFVHILDAELAAALPAPAPRRPPAPAAAGAAAGGTARSHTGYLPSVDDMLLAGEVPPPEQHQQPAGAEACTSPAAGGSSVAATPRAVHDSMFEGLLSSSDDSDWEADMEREHSAASAAATAAAAAAGAEASHAVPGGAAGEATRSALAGAQDSVASDSTRQPSSEMAAHGAGKPEGWDAAANLSMLSVGTAGAEEAAPLGGCTLPAASMAPAAGQEQQGEGACSGASGPGSPPSPVPGSSMQPLGNQLPEAAAGQAADAEQPEPEAMQQPSAPSGSASSAAGQARKGPLPVSPHALGALWDLVQCCVGTQTLVGGAAEGAVGPAASSGGGTQQGDSRRMAKQSEAEENAGDSDVEGEEGAGEGRGEGGAAQQEGPGEGEVCERAPRLGWYDARARVALHLVAAWLQVPWRKVANFELLLANEKAPAPDKEAPAAAAARGGESSWDQRMRWLKVGAAAVGGGALFAVTGGLAAPALAAGLGSVMTMVGGSTAVVGATTGFLASTAGSITVATTLGAAGAASTGSKMSYRTAGVSEFGFRELVEGPRGGTGGGGSAAAAAGPGSMQQEQQEQRRDVDEGGQQLGNSTAAGAPQQQPAANGGAGSSAAAEGAASSADGGHLLCSPSKPVAAASRPPSRPPSCARLHGSTSADSLASSCSGTAAGGPPAAPGSGLGEASTASGTTPARAPSASASAIKPAADAPSPAGAAAPPAGEPSPGEPSAWQRWFGKKQEEPPLLPVPLRIRGAGDVKLSALVFVSGWVTEPSDYVTQWEGIRAADADQFCLVWESRELLALNSALGSLVAKQAASQGAQFAVQHFFYAGAGLLSALAPALLLDTATGLLIENAWAVASGRSVRAGKLLAHLLLAGGHGGRPVTLVAHSMGARLVFHCLLELCRHDARGIVQDVCLLGTPVSTRPERWHMARRVVAGRLVNAYSRRDWLLGVVFTGASGFVKAAAGLCPVEGVPGVENVNLTSVVSGHFDYLEQLGDVLDSMALLA